MLKVGGQLFQSLSNLGLAMIEVLFPDETLAAQVRNLGRLSKVSRLVCFFRLFLIFRSMRVL
jgi:hypothetical protein